MQDLIEYLFRKATSLVGLSKPLIFGAHTMCESAVCSLEIEKYRVKRRDIGQTRQWILL